MRPFARWPGIKSDIRFNSLFTVHTSPLVAADSTVMPENCTWPDTGCIVHWMPTKRHLLPSDELTFEIVWEPGTLGSSAMAVVDACRLINRIADLKTPHLQAPLNWRWVGCDGHPVAPPATTHSPDHEHSGATTGRLPKAYRSMADVLVVPGWMARDGLEVDQWVARCRPLMPRLQQTLAQGGALLASYTGVALLAAAGCLQHRRFAAPGPFFVSMMRHARAANTPDTGAINWSESSDWASDQSVWTCASPVATTEAVLDLIGYTPLADLSRAAVDVLLPSPLRQGVAVAHARNEGASLERNRVPNGMVERARQWLLQHITEPYDLVALAQAAATSPRTLARHFIADHGMSAHQYLERLRIERACLMLQTTYVPVEEIGRASGLSSPGTFRRVFRRHTGELPGEYRRRHSLRTQRTRWGSMAAAASSLAPGEV